MPMLINQNLNQHVFLRFLTVESRTKSRALTVDEHHYGSASMMIYITVIGGVVIVNCGVRMMDRIRSLSTDEC